MTQKVLPSRSRRCRRGQRSPHGQNRKICLPKESQSLFQFVLFFYFFKHHLHFFHKFKLYNKKLWKLTKFRNFGVSRFNGFHQGNQNWKLLYSMLKCTITRKKKKQNKTRKFAGKFSKPKDKLSQRLNFLITARRISVKKIQWRSFSSQRKLVLSVLHPSQNKKKRPRHQQQQNYRFRIRVSPISASPPLRYVPPLILSSWLTPEKGNAQVNRTKCHQTKKPCPPPFPSLRSRVLIGGITHQSWNWHRSHQFVICEHLTGILSIPQTQLSFAMDGYVMLAELFLVDFSLYPSAKW